MTRLSCESRMNLERPFSGFTRLYCTLVDPLNIVDNQGSGVNFDFLDNKILLMAEPKRVSSYMVHAILLFIIRTGNNVKMNVSSAYMLVLVVLVMTAGCVSVQTESGGEKDETDSASMESGPQSQEDTVPELPMPPRRPHPSEYPVANFEDDDLYKLLVAEVAAGRGHVETALENYVEVAVSSRDPGVAARATDMARFLQKNDTALKTARIWAKEDPDDLDAHIKLAELMMRVGDVESAVSHMEEVKRLGGLDEFGRFVLHSAELDEKSRALLLATIERMLLKEPADRLLIFSRAVLLGKSGEYEEVLRITDQLLADGNETNVIILKLNVLSELQKNEEAVEFLQRKLDESPENRHLRIVYARHLFDKGKMDESRIQYETALEQSPNDAEIMHALALIAMNQGNDTVAVVYLNDMILLNHRVREAHFYQGNIAERRNDIRKAIQEYKKVNIGYGFVGDYFERAHTRVAWLLMQHNRVREARDHLARVRAAVPILYQQFIQIEARLLSDHDFEEEVFSLLDNQLIRNPNNIVLLRTRAMVSEKFDRLDMMERDLRAIIDIDPKNATAMNDLGYTLTNRTDRYEEALVLIEKALSINPGEAAFIDSLGWVKYRLKQFEEAVLHLRRALELFPNDEVAAHLGEVLWVMGQKIEANKVWEKALELTPDSDILNRVIQQFIPQ